METGIPCEIIWLESIWLPSSVNLFTKQINLIIPRLYSPKYWTSHNYRGLFEIRTV